MTETTPGARIAWIDTARGIALALVVVHHVLQQQPAVSETSWAIEFADRGLDGFRMPVLFLLSGMLSAPLLERPWWPILKRRVLPYAYLYVVWGVVSIAAFTLVPLVGYGALSTWDALRAGLTEPFGVTWYLGALVIYVTLARVLRRVPWPALAVVAAGANLWLFYAEPGIGTWAYIVQHWVYFVVALGLAQQARRLGHWATPSRALGLVAAFAFLAAAAVELGVVDDGVTLLLLSSAGVSAGILLASALDGTPLGRPFTAIGRHSLAVYVTHPLMIGLLLTAVAPIPDAVDPLLKYALPTVGAAAICAAGVWLGKVVTARGVFSPPWSTARGDGQPARAAQPERSLA